MFMHKRLKEMGARLLILLCGLTVAHFGVTLFLLADLGSDPFNVLVQGMHRALDLAWFTHGNTHMALCLLIIAVLLFVDRRYILPGTVVCMLCGGPIIDGFTALLSPLFEKQPSLWTALLLQAAGCVILAAGMTVVIKSGAGTGPNDLVAVVLSDKLHRSFGIVRLLVDGVFVLAGFLLGGSVGLGTIVCVVLVGPVAGFFLPLSERLVRRLLGRMGIRQEDTAGK